MNAPSPYPLPQGERDSTGDTPRHGQRRAFIRSMRRLTRMPRHVSTFSMSIGMDTVTVVLVESQGDANIGMVARAIKNCGITRLVLVNPVPFDTPRGRAMACSAQEVLHGARVVVTLQEALGEASYVAGFTARTGKNRRSSAGYDEEMATLARRSRAGRVALVFGREDDGLTNDELGHCDALITIPTSTAYQSLNLAQAVLLACHELFRRSESVSEETPDLFIPREDYAPLMQRIDEMLADLGYRNDVDSDLARKIAARLGDIFGRAGLLPADVKMWEGLIERIIDCSCHPRESGDP